MDEPGKSNIVELKLNRSQQRSRDARTKQQERKVRARQRQEQDKAWARLRKHVEAAVLYEIQQRGPQEFDKKTREVQDGLQDFVRAKDISLSLTVSSLANYLSRLTYVLEELKAGKLQVCPECQDGKTYGPENLCPLCKGTTLVRPDELAKYKEAHDATQRRGQVNPSTTDGEGGGAEAPGAGD